MLKQQSLKVVVTFHTTAGAMALERACKQQGIEGRLFPIPRELSSDCGIAWQSAPTLRTALEQMIQEQTLEISGIYELIC